MPRRTLVRRFEPRYGVNQSMLEVESKYVARELEDHLLQSASALKERLAKWHELMVTAEEELRARLIELPDRDRLALRCMFARDMWHIAKLYRTFLESASARAAAPAESERTGVVTRAPEELHEAGRPSPILPFKETLFG